MSQSPDDLRQIIDGIVASASADEEFAQRLRANPLETLRAAGIAPQDAATLLDAFADENVEVGGYMFDTLGFCRPLTEWCSGKDDGAR